MHVFYIESLGISIRIATNSDFVFDNLSKDFSLFLKGPSAVTGFSIDLSVLAGPAPVERVPPKDASFYALGFICYKVRNINYVVYSNESLLIYDFDKEKGELFGLDEFFIYEKAKVLILSRMGELLDKKGIHRAHAFGISYKGKNLICLLPMEGGKTTTILNLLRAEPGIKVIADDICFIDKRGRLYPFILRVGARGKDLVEGIPQEFVDEIHRPYYGVKYFINPLYFKDRLSGDIQLTHILVGIRTFKQETTLEPLAKFRSFNPLFESCIFGRGLPTLFELFIRGDSRLFWQRVMIVLKRTFLCISLLFFTRTYLIKIGRNKDSTAHVILDFLNQWDG